jgi:hypothetical protein
MPSTLFVVTIVDALPPFTKWSSAVFGNDLQGINSCSCKVVINELNNPYLFTVSSGWPFESLASFCYFLLLLVHTNRPTRPFLISMCIARWIIVPCTITPSRNSSRMNTEKQVIGSSKSSEIEQMDQELKRKL